MLSPYVRIWAFFQKPPPRKGGFLEGGFHVSGAFRKTIAEGRRFRKPGLREGGLAEGPETYFRQSTTAGSCFPALLEYVFWNLGSDIRGERLLLCSLAQEIELCRATCLLSSSGSQTGGMKVAAAGTTSEAN
jgi:hypothetical protein